MKMEHIIKRFIKYITIDTQSDPNNPEFPSTDKQWDLAKILVEDLKEIGKQEVILDENCYIMATLPSTIDFEVPTIGFISHIDTSPDFSGTNVNPQIH
ncbi:MAG: peptidase T, partial [Flavobacteriaceae bacterium]|nr:peptidase T [Flavobacteriaceae bacterium]